MEGLNSSKVTQKEDGMEHPSRILSLAPATSPDDRGQKNKRTEQPMAGQTPRISVSLGLRGLWPHELFTRESAGRS